MPRRRTLVTKARLIAHDPRGAGLVARADRNASWMQQRLAARARRQGITGLHLVVSFDCDTVEDIRVARQVHDRMLSMGIVPTYAVPGAHLRRGAAVWRALAESGSPFLNHGGAEHAAYYAEDRRFEATLFYNDLTHAQIEADVRAGHEAVLDVIGAPPSGFRAPHFGSLASPAYQRLLHDVCRGLGYDHSSSTLPLEALRSGPATDVGDLLEFPVSGVPGKLLQPFDSWSFFAAPDRHRSPDDYLSEARRLAALAHEAGDGVLNCYADPAHVHDEPTFFSAMQALVEVAHPTTFDALVAERRSTGAPRSGT